MFADKLENIDINPVIMSADGCIAVDALVIPKTAALVATRERKAE
jgi:hypothetical protein